MSTEDIDAFTGNCLTEIIVASFDFDESIKYYIR